ncbi:hypothetical protein BJY52DRAFT_1257983 [Lactarius psammicola]|nr:hypothetical protein BJY52DRAFT_1257983 [Lactarius psammicola]
MLSFYPSAVHSHYYSPLYSARPVYYDDSDIMSLHPSTSDYSYLPRTTDPESHYRRTLAEYLVAEEELFRAHEEATLRARAEALWRQEEARLLRARIIRARKEQQVQQLEQVPHVVPVAYSIPERCMTPIPSVLAAQTPQIHVSLTGGSQLPDSMPRSPAYEEGQLEHRATPHVVPMSGASAPTLESLLRARLRKIASYNEDENVQDLARAIFHHLVQHASDGDANNTSALSSETKLDSSTRPEGADLSRSDALQGAAAEAAKDSFKAHRANVAEQVAPPASSKPPVSQLETIQDIRATLSKLSADFSIPPSLDFSDDEADGLAYTPTNAPIRVYEHALEGLLAQLDAVGSDGDEEVRKARRTVVKEVEMALEGVEKKVMRAKEAAKDNSKPGEDSLWPEVKTEEEEHSASNLSHTTAASYSTATEGTSTPSAEESTEVVTALMSSTSPATVQEKVAHVYTSTSDVPESIYSPITEQLIPAHQPSVFTASETREEAVSLSPEGFTLTSTPVSPAFLPPALPEDVSASRMSASPRPEEEGAGPDDAVNEDGWSEVEA